MKKGVKLLSGTIGTKSTNDQWYSFNKLQTNIPGETGKQSIGTHSMSLNVGYSSLS